MRAITVGNFHIVYTITYNNFPQINFLGVIAKCSILFEGDVFSLKGIEKAFFPPGITCYDNGLGGPFRKVKLFTNMIIF